MVTTVEVSERTKSRLEDLQAEIEHRTGKEVTQQEILAKLVDDAFESKSTVADSFQETTVPLTEEQKEAFNRGTFESGVETSEEDIDDIVYGSDIDI